MTPEQPQDEGRTRCTPCRGTGRVISALGGTPHQLPCPWCGGSGRFRAGGDAQQHPAETSAASG